FSPSTNRDFVPLTDYFLPAVPVAAVSTFTHAFNCLLVANKKAVLPVTVIYCFAHLGYSWGILGHGYQKSATPGAFYELDNASTFCCEGSQLE
ncbi:MAG: hypothetical protein EBZ77_06710, partial [Chitinophagia bacterium]|nr:hypothetical protein [Chitinophagia bacterium]